jgi:CRP/FNR family transcriptional regulator, cyclic AMP receptor protein
MTGVRDLERTFARTALLSGLTPSERRRLASRATTHSYPVGSTILRQGDTSMAVYVILTGRVAVQIGAQVVREIGTDGFFGELGVLDDAPRSATIVALEPTECALLGAWDVRRNPRIALGLLPILAQRLREAQAREPRTEAEWLAAMSGDAQ